ncbi:hypothetical protein MRX96_014296 [Rhipicephalus microplus]
MLPWRSVSRPLEGWQLTGLTGPVTAGVGRRNAPAQVMRRPRARSAPSFLPTAHRLLLGRLPLDSVKGSSASPTGSLAEENIVPAAFDYQVCHRHHSIGHFQDGDNEAVPLLSATLFPFYEAAGRGRATFDCQVCHSHPPIGYFQDDDDEAVPLLSATLFRFYQGAGQGRAAFDYQVCHSHPPIGYFQDDDDEAVPLLSVTLFRFYQGAGRGPSRLRLPSLP